MRLWMVLLAGCPYIGDQSADIDGDGRVGEEDCVEGDANVYANAEERCDGLDNDCNGSIDDNPVDIGTWYLDQDLDGFGAGDPVLACEGPDGRVTTPGDCNDDLAEVYPGAEQCGDHIADNDCDSADDECRWIGSYPSEHQAAVAVPEASFAYGYSVGVMDMNADEIPDLLISDPYSSNTGELYFVRGDGDRTFRAPTLYDLNTGELGSLGAAICANVDFTGDGQPDVAVGAPSYGYDGKVLLVDDPVAGEFYTIQTGNEGNAFGASLARVQIDGEPRLVVGAPGQSTEFGGASVVYVLYDLITGASGAVLNARTLLSDEYSLGTSVVGLNHPDSNTGRIAFDGRASNDQKVWILPADGEQQVFLDDGVSEIPGAWEITFFPLSSYWLYLANAGDLDGDGFEDLAVGDLENGTIWLFSLSGEGGTISPDDAWASITLEGVERLGLFVQAIDLDGDGATDLAAAKINEDDEDYPAEVVVMYGPFTAGEHNFSGVPSANLGENVFVHPLGDVDGDGFDDLATSRMLVEMQDDGSDLSLTVHFGYGN